MLKKLPFLDKWIDRRREIAKKYNDKLKNTNLQLPIEHVDNKHAYYIYVVAHPERDKIISNLSKKYTFKYQLSMAYSYNGCLQAFRMFFMYLLNKN